MLGSSVVKRQVAGHQELEKHVLGHLKQISADLE